MDSHQRARDDALLSHAVEDGNSGTEERCNGSWVDIFRDANCCFSADKGIFAIEAITKDLLRQLAF